MRIVIPGRTGGAAAIAIGLSVLVGCAGGSATPADRAMEVLRGMTDTADPTYNQDQHAYVLDVASRSSAPRTGALLLEGAAAKAYNVSSTALHGLMERKVDGGAAALEPVFQEKRGAIKVNAALALAQQGGADAVEWLASALADERQRPGREVAVALARQGKEDEVRAYLAREVAAKDERARDDAYLALGQIGTDWAKFLLLEGLDQEHGERRQAAIVGIGLTGDPALVPKVVKFINTQGLVTATIEALGRLGGPVATKNLKGALGHDEPLVRAYAVDALLRGEEPDAAREALVALQHDPDPGVRQLIALRLADVDRDLAREALAALARDEDRGVRLEAMRGLLRRGTPADVALFTEAASDPDYQVQAVALEALGRVAGPEVVSATLEPLLEADNPYVRIAAAAAIVEIDGRTPKA